MNRKEILAHFQAEMDFKIPQAASAVMFDAIVQHVLVGRSLIILRKASSPVQAMAIDAIVASHGERLAALIGSLAELSDTQPALMGSGFKLLLQMVDKEASEAQAETVALMEKVFGKRGQQP